MSSYSFDEPCDWASHKLFNSPSPEETLAQSRIDKEWNYIRERILTDKGVCKLLKDLSNILSSTLHDTVEWRPSENSQFLDDIAGNISTFEAFRLRDLQEGLKGIAALTDDASYSPQMVASMAWDTVKQWTVSRQYHPEWVKDGKLFPFKTDIDRMTVESELLEKYDFHKRASIIISNDDNPITKHFHRLESESHSAIATMLQDTIQHLSPKKGSTWFTTDDNPPFIILMTENDLQEMFDSAKIANSERIKQLEDTGFQQDKLSQIQPAEDDLVMMKSLLKLVEKTEAEWKDRKSRKQTLTSQESKSAVATLGELAKRIQTQFVTRRE